MKSKPPGLARAEITYPVIECGSLTVLLQHQGPLSLYLQPIERLVKLPGTAFRARQAAVQITARRDDDPQAPVLYAVCRAAEATGLNPRGSLTYPYRHFASPSELDAVVQRLQTELHEALLHLFRECSSVRALLTPGRFRLPDAWIWSARTTLDGLIVLHDTHWRYQPQ